MATDALTFMLMLSFTSLLTFLFTDSIKMRLVRTDYCLFHYTFAGHTGLFSVMHVGLAYIFCILQ